MLASHPVEKPRFLIPDPLRKLRQALDSVLGYLNQPVYVPVEKIAWSNLKPADGHGDADTDDTEVRVAGDCPSGKVVEAQPADLRKIADGGVSDEAYGSEALKDG